MASKQHSMNKTKKVPVICIFKTRNNQNKKILYTVDTENYINFLLNFNLMLHIVMQTQVTLIVGKHIKSKIKDVLHHDENFSSLKKRIVLKRDKLLDFYKLKI